MHMLLQKLERCHNKLSLYDFWMILEKQCDIQPTYSLSIIHIQYDYLPIPLFFFKTYKTHTIFNSVLNQSPSIVLVVGVKTVTAHLIHLEHNNIHDIIESAVFVLLCWSALH